MILRTYAASRAKVGFNMLYSGGIFLYLIYNGLSTNVNQTHSINVFALLMYFFSIPFFILFIYSLKIYRNCKYPLILKSDGIYYEPMIIQHETNFIPWTEIVDVTVTKLAKNTYTILLTLRDGDFSSNIKISDAHKFLLGNSVSLSCDLVKGDIDDICADIREILDSKRS